MRTVTGRSPCTLLQFPHPQSKAGGTPITMPRGLAPGKERRMLCSSLVLEKPGQVWVCGTQDYTAAAGQGAGVPPSPMHPVVSHWEFGAGAGIHPHSLLGTLSPLSKGMDTKTSDIPLHFPAALAGLVAVLGHPDVWLRQQTSTDALGPWPGTLCHGPVWAARGDEDPHQPLPRCLLPAPSPSRVSASSFHHHSQCVLTWLQK